MEIKQYIIWICYNKLNNLYLFINKYTSNKMAL